MSMQRRRFQAVKGVTCGVQFHICYLFKTEEIVGVDRRNDLFIGFKVAFQKFRFFNAPQRKGAGLIFEMAECFSVPRIVKKDQRMRLDDAFGNFSLPVGVGDFYAVIGLSPLKQCLKNFRLDIGVQPGKNAQTFHIGGVQKVRIVVLQKVVHCVAYLVFQG